MANPHTVTFQDTGGLDDTFSVYVHSESTASVLWRLMRALDRMKTSGGQVRRKGDPKPVDLPPRLDFEAGDAAAAFVSFTKTRGGGVYLSNTHVQYGIAREPGLGELGFLVQEARQEAHPIALDVSVLSTSGIVVAELLLTPTDCVVQSSDSPLIDVAAEELVFRLSLEAPQEH